MVANPIVTWQSAAEAEGQSARERAVLWLERRLGEEVNVEVGGGWAVEVSGTLRNWRGTEGLYLVGDALLDVSGLGEIRVRETVPSPGTEQMILEFDDGIGLTVTVLGPLPCRHSSGLLRNSA